MMARGSCISLLFVFFALVGSLKSANCDRLSYEDDASSENKQAWREFQEFREWRKTRHENLGRDADYKIEDLGRIFSLKKQPSAGLVEPPPVDQPALMGRYIVNQADWTAVATISTRKDIESFPTTNVISVSDGPIGKGSGIPYMFLTPLDFTAQDLARDDRATLLMSLAQGSYCKGKDMDPMDPRCARIILTGRIHEVKNSSSEFETAKNAVFGRHPWLQHMPENHHFFFAKLEISSIVVLATFGGPNYVSIKDYMNPPTPKYRQNHHLHRSDTPRDDNSSFKSEEVRFVYRI